MSWQHRTARIVAWISSTAVSISFALARQLCARASMRRVSPYDKIVRVGQVLRAHHRENRRGGSSAGRWAGREGEGEGSRSGRASARECGDVSVQERSARGREGGAERQGEERASADPGVANEDQRISGSGSAAGQQRTDSADTVCTTRDHDGSDTELDHCSPLALLGQGPPRWPSPDPALRRIASLRCQRGAPRFARDRCASLGALLRLAARCRSGSRECQLGSARTHAALDRALDRSTQGRAVLRARGTEAATPSRSTGRLNAPCSTRRLLIPP